METNTKKEEEYYTKHIVRMVSEIRSLKLLKEIYYGLLWIKLNQ